MADVTYYFNGYDSVSQWETTPGNMIDGSISTFASTATNGEIQKNDSNTCPGDDLGTITKVELRIHHYSNDSDDYISIRYDASVWWHDIPILQTADWSPYIDITGEEASWTWTMIQNMFCQVQFIKTAKASGANCSKVEIRVTYTPSATYVDLDGSTAGQSSASGAANPFRGINGLSTGQSGLEALLKMYYWRLVGNIAGQSSLVGNIKPIRCIVGDITGQSNLTGEISIGAIVELAGSIDGTGGVNGNTVLNLSLIGQSDGQSAIDGLLRVLRNLMGDVGGQSSLIGALKPNRNIVGSLNGTSNISGLLKILRSIVGSSTGQSNVSGTIKPLRNITGISEAQSSVVGSLTLLWSLIGEIAGQSELTGELTIGIGFIELTGIIDGQSNVEGKINILYSVTGIINAQGGIESTLRKGVWVEIPSTSLNLDKGTPVLFIKAGKKVFILELG